MPEPVSIKSINRRITWLLVLINLSVPAFVLVQRKHDGLSDATNIWVGWTSAAMMTAMFLVMSYLRLPAAGRRIPLSMAATALILVFLSGLITTISISAPPTANVLQLAKSSIPLSEIQPERKRLLVEFIRRDIASTAENNRMTQSTKPLSPALYSIESFANKEVMESTSSQLKKAYGTDQAYAAALAQARQDFRHKMWEVDPGYLQGFDAKMHDRDVLDAAILTTDEKWATNSFTLYQYAIDHAGQISMDKSDRLEIADLDVRKNFLQQLSDCRRWSKS